MRAPLERNPRRIPDDRQQEETHVTTTPVTTDDDAMRKFASAFGEHGYLNLPRRVSFGQLPASWRNRGSLHGACLTSFGDAALQS